MTVDVVGSKALWLLAGCCCGCVAVVWCVVACHMYSHIPKAPVLSTITWRIKNEQPSVYGYKICASVVS